MIRVFSFSRWSLTLLVLITIFVLFGFFSQLQDTYSLPRPIHIPFSQHVIDPNEDAHETTYVDSTIQLEAIDPHEAIRHANAAPHPIDELVRRADTDMQEVLVKETKGKAEAAKAYRKRRGRHPPPKFDEWVEFAESCDAVMIEDFFDQIYRDLEPFWAMPAKSMKDAVAAWPHTISVHAGNATFRTDNERPWMNLWANMTAQLADKLPDMDIAINEMDEPRLLVPFDHIERLVGVASQRRKKPHPTRKNPVKNEFPAVPVPKWDSDRFDFSIANSPPSYWALANSACHPNSPGAQAEPLTDYDNVPIFPKGNGNGTFEGYVSNWTMAKDPCVHPHLRELHGSFVEPISISTSMTLFPIFGGSKLSMNNDILLPPAMYWSDEEQYAGGEKRIPWEQKTAKVVWRGVASGGRNRETNWKHFHRHRLVRMLNSTHVAELENHAEQRAGSIFPWPDTQLYRVHAADEGLLGQWLSRFASAEFVDLVCFPQADPPARTCAYTAEYFSLGTDMPMAEQFRFKLIPDMDGNSFSGRYRAFLRSFSLPLKATIYSEWHDDRLWPWKHFVPLDNTFTDLWGVLEYFLGYDAGSLSMQRITEHRGWAEQQGPAPKPKPKARRGAAGPIPHAHARRQDAGAGGAGATDEGNPAGAVVAANHEDATGTAEDGPGGAQADADAPPPPPQAQASTLVPPHDRVARYIAESGHNWAERVLRREDMLIYLYRLLLEYARLVAEDRDRMGWVGDLEYDEEADAMWGIGTGPTTTSSAAV